MLRVVAADPKSGHPVYGLTRRVLMVFGLALGGMIAALVIAVVVLFAQRHDSGIYCRAAREQAAINAAGARLMRERSERLLPRANIPGISHAELVRSTREGEAQETMRITQLEALARRTCSSL